MYLIYTPESERGRTVAVTGSEKVTHQHQCCLALGFSSTASIGVQITLIALSLHAEQWTSSYGFSVLWTGSIYVPACRHEV